MKQRREAYGFGARDTNENEHARHVNGPRSFARRTIPIVSEKWRTRRNPSPDYGPDIRVVRAFDAPVESYRRKRLQSAGS